MTRATLRKTIQRAELTASLLRQPGFSRLGLEERRRIADDLTTPAQAARRLFDADAFADTPALYDRTADDDATQADLLGGAA